MLFIYAFIYLQITSTNNLFIYKLRVFFLQNYIQYIHIYTIENYIQYIHIYIQ